MLIDKNLDWCLEMTTITWWDIKEISFVISLVFLLEEYFAAQMLLIQTSVDIAFLVISSVSFVSNVKYIEEKD